MYVGFSVIDSWKIIHILQSCHQRSAFLDAETIVVDFSTKDEHNALLHKVFTRQMDWFVDYSAVDSMNNQSNFLKAEMFQRLQWEDFLFPLLCFYIIVNLISLSFGLLAEGKKKKRHNHNHLDCDWCSLPFAGISKTKQLLLKSKSNHQSHNERKVVSCSPTFFFRQFNAEMSKSSVLEHVVVYSHSARCSHRCSNPDESLILFKVTVPFGWFGWCIGGWVGKTTKTTKHNVNETEQSHRPWISVQPYAFPKRV